MGRSRKRSAVAISIASLWLLGLMVHGSMAQVTQSCLTSFGALSDPCDPYFNPGITATPLPSCCTAMGDLLASDPTCICDVIVAAAAAGTSFNRTRLVEVFVQCQLVVPATATYCLPALPPSATPSISSPPLPIVTPSPPVVIPSPPPTVIVTPSPPPTVMVPSSPPSPIVIPSPPPTVIVTPSPPPTIIVPSSPPPPSKSSTPSTISSPPPPPPSTRSTPPPPSASSTPPPPPSTGLFGLGSAGNSLLHGSSPLLSSCFIFLTLLATFII